MFASLASRASMISARGGGCRVLSSTFIRNNTSYSYPLGVTSSSSQQNINRWSSSSNNHVAGGEYGEGEAKGYQAAKKVDFRERVELYTTLGLVGDASGKRVIDVACGTGVNKSFKRCFQCRICDRYRFISGNDSSGKTRRKGYNNNRYFV